MIDWAFQPNWLAASGILWDLSGAFALARGWLFATDERIKRQSGSYYGASPAMSRAAAEQRLEYRLGFSHLLVGFIVQLFASAGIAASFAVAACFAAPIALHWIIFLSTYHDRVVTDGVRASISADAAESTWRAHYPDVSDLTWSRALINAGIEFKYKVPPRH